MKKGNKLNKTLSVISKITEIIHWIGAGISALMIFISIIDKNFITECTIEEGADFLLFDAYGFDVNALTQTGDINHFAVTMAFVGIMITFILMALVFRNLDIILTTIMGKNQDAESTSPFQKDVVRRVREIGIFSIAIPVVGFVITTIITAVSLINGNSVEVSTAWDGVVVGLVCLCLTQIFSYGAQLEEEVDGLL